MRFYPFGSSSLNQVYNPSGAITASVSQYAETASFTRNILSASYAINGVPGLSGSNGSCSYQAGPQGPTGSVGFSGALGGISIAYPSGSVYGNP